MDLIKNDLIIEKMRCEKLLAKYSAGSKEEQIISFHLEEEIKTANKAIDGWNNDDMLKAIKILKTYQ